MIDKEALRTRYRRLRDEVPEETCQKSSLALCENIGRLGLLDEYSMLAGYVSFRNEIDIGSYLNERLAAGRGVCLPRVVGEHLEFVRVDSLDDLSIGAFGIREPHGIPFPTNEIEAFIVPGLVFDRQGGRLGFGKGFYDRVLGSRSVRDKGSEPLAIGVGYRWQLIDSTLPVEPHDVSMDVIATDGELVSTSARVQI